MQRSQNNKPARLRYTRALWLATSLKTRGMVAGRMDDIVLARSKQSVYQVLAEAVCKWKEESRARSQNTGLVWLDLVGTHGPLLRVQARVSFSEKVPLTGEDVLAREREAWVASGARRAVSGGGER